MTDSADTVAQKIRKAKTDPKPMPETMEELDARPEAANLLGIYAALTDHTLEATVARFAGKGFSEFKEALADVATVTLGRIGGEMQRLKADHAHIDAVLRRGAERAEAIAGPILREVEDITGLLRP
jgi:tryptophanyl-tRNA synthetase